MRSRSLPATLALVAAIVVTGAVSPIPALAEAHLYLEVQAGDPRVSGLKPNVNPIKVKLLRSNGKALETRHDNTTLLEWSVCFVDHLPVAGNKIQLINGTDEDRTVTVPDLAMELDRVASVVRGHAPAGKTIQLRYLECDPSRCAKGPAFTAHGNSHGRYHTDISSSVDIDGSDMVRADYVNGRGDRFYRFGVAPYMRITKPNRIRVTCMPQGTTTVRLLDSTGALRASKSFHAQQECMGFLGSFRKGGHAVNIHAGDRITSDFAADARLVWPTISALGSGTTLSGQCFSHVRWVMSIQHDGVSTSYNGTTDADGLFSVTVASAFAPGDTLHLVCESIRGDQVELVRTLPV